MEHDPWVSCPYDKVHQVPLSRIQGHIVKCEKNHPPLSICPYNATHRLPESEMKIHVKNCPSKAVIFPEDRCNVAGKITTPKPMLQRDYIPEDDPNNELWDDEL